MHILEATFAGSSTDPRQTPTPSQPAFAFIGRSNVGKSSLINCLTRHKNLAKTSSTPGKTQLINYFLINNNWYLVDLPGYGWARVSKQKKRIFQTIAQNYLLYNPVLLGTFVLIDSRHPPQDIDLGFINWLGQNKCPLAIVFTKVDKVSKSQLQASLSMFQKALLQTWEVLPPHFITSARHNIGCKPLLDYIHNYLPT